MATKTRCAEYHFGLEIRSDDTVVDVGCGVGDACVFAGRVGAEVIGLDIEPSLIARSTERMLGVPARSFRGIVGDADPIPLAEGTASVVICTEVLEHVDDPARVLAELARIGRPGARYLITVPDPASESVMRAIAPGWYFEKPIHQHVYEHDRLDALVRGAGLEVDTRSFGRFKESVWWFLRMAAGMRHKHAPVPDLPIFDDWDRLVSAIEALPAGPALLRELDRLVPKSQVVIARKPATSGWLRTLGLGDAFDRGR